MNRFARASLALLAVAALLFGACEKPVWDDDEGVTGDPSPAIGATDGTRFVVTLGGPASFEPYSPTTPTAASADRHAVGELCSRLSLAVFKDGLKVGKTYHQTASDAHFGTFDVALDEGVYQVVAVAHSGTASCTITSLEEVSFPNNKMTDTFVACETVKVTDEPAQQNLVLERCVAKIRVEVREKTPKTVAQVQFFYTGGSSTLNPSTALGAKQSRQTEVREVAPEAYANASYYELYTIPHEEKDSLKEIRIASLNAVRDTLSHRELKNIYFRAGQVTEVATYLYSENPDNGRAKEYLADGR